MDRGRKLAGRGDGDRRVVGEDHVAIEQGRVMLGGGQSAEHGRDLGKGRPQGDDYPRRAMERQSI